MAAASHINPTSPNFGLEIWAIGTDQEIDLLIRMVEANGRLLQPAEPTHLAGADRNRSRVYIRAAMNTTPPADC